MNSASLSRLAAASLLLAALAAPARADVCVWRDPERTMQKIFPQARDYKTVTVKISPSQVNEMEKALGTALDESEKNEFNFYDIMEAVEGKPRKLGTIMALAGKGEYGVIEVVVGLDADSKIVGVYIQRSRERVTKALQSRAFLDQFAGKTAKDQFEIGRDIRPASSSAMEASRVVSFVVKKMLVFYGILNKGGNHQ